LNIHIFLNLKQRAGAVAAPGLDFQQPVSIVIGYAIRACAEVVPDENPTLTDCFS
jgi:hypothetical protein